MNDTPNPPDNPCLNAAIEAVSLGLHPIPVGDNKKPFIPWVEFQTRQPTQEEIEEWWAKWPDANVAIITGTPGGVDVIDFDPGHDSWPPEGFELPTFCVVQTLRDGRHYYLPHIPGIRNSAGKLGYAIDVRGEGGYVLIPPSSIGDKSYAYLLGSLEDVLSEYKIPDWLLSALTVHPTEPVKIIADSKGAAIPESRRNATLASMAGAMRRKNMPVEAIQEALLLTNQTQCLPPLGLREVEEIANSIGRYEPSPSTFNRTDSGNAEMFVELYGDRVRYDHNRNRWLIWQNHWWAEDLDGELPRLALNAARHRLFAAVGSKDTTDKKKEIAHAISSESRQRLDAALTLAKNMIPIAEAGYDWDRNSWLLGVVNGVVDLTTGELRDGQPEDKITVHSPIKFDANAACPMFEAFLQKITDGNEILIDYLQRLCGLCLTGYAGVQTLFILWGEGGNGKNTLLDTISNILGPYACEAPPGLMIVKKNEDHPTEIADLVNRRMVIASETEKNVSLRIQLVKKLTGNKTLKGRFIRQNYFEFERTFKTLLVTNNKPVIRENTIAVKRRIVLIPFTVDIPESEWILNYHDVLKPEHPGILNWMLQGCLKFIEHKLPSPNFVKDATTDYLESQNPIADFIEDGFELHPQAFVSRATIWEKYLEYCKNNNIRWQLTKQDLFESLRKTTGITEFQKRVANKPTKGFLGIGLIIPILSE